MKANEQQSQRRVSAFERVGALGSGSETYPRRSAFTTKAARTLVAGLILAVALAACSTVSGGAVATPTASSGGMTREASAKGPGGLGLSAEAGPRPSAARRARQEDRAGCGPRTVVSPRPERHTGSRGGRNGGRVPSPVTTEC